ncbi:uncharacterized protein L3040_007923 [Drepanopeziza brunnea f. sp. 'multigermtubi']|uniref:uncharacterized protein n=1 Tax=Drepanopeziza brunnea f. sp. 'multigermtubi' TaxID=698441 RepID=UPI00239338EB|nr:hypothetical protein L3040_007923 [Drepanopeziza brunnea f. sp. 'multigermtubi']
MYLLSKHYLVYFVTSHSLPVLPTATVDGQDYHVPDQRKPLGVWEESDIVRRVVRDSEDDSDSDSEDESRSDSEDDEETGKGTTDQSFLARIHDKLSRWGAFKKDWTVTSFYWSSKKDLYEITLDGNAAEVAPGDFEATQLLVMHSLLEAEKLYSTEFQDTISFSVYTNLFVRLLNVPHITLLVYHRVRPRLTPVRPRHLSFCDYDTATLLS